MLHRFERSAGAAKVLVVINTSDQDSETCAPQSDGGAFMATTFAGGTVLADDAPGANGETFTVAPSGSVAVMVPAHGFSLLVAR